MAETHRLRGKFKLGNIKGNYVVPNTVTILGLLSGTTAILFAIKGGSFLVMAYLLILAAFFDSLDGRLARLMKGSSEFGVQLDSLCDMVSFGIAPALVAYAWLDEPLGRLGMMAVFLFVACGALRLARFNVYSGKIDSNFFIGLPIPAAAGVIATSIIFIETYFPMVDKGILSIVFVADIFILAFLMVSTVPFYSFKNMSYFKKRPFNSLVLMVLFIFAMGLYHEALLFIMIIIYTVSGLTLGFLRMRRKGHRHHNSDNGESIAEDSK